MENSDNRRNFVLRLINKQEKVSTMNLKISVIVLLLFLAGGIPLASAETIIYDNITTSQYKQFMINDDQNFPLVGDFNYDIYIDGNYYKSVSKGEKFDIPDSSNIIIYAPVMIKQDIGEGVSAGIGLVSIAITVLITFGVGVFVIYWFWKKGTAKGRGYR